MSNVSRNANWQTFYNDYEKNQSHINPIYNVGDDSEKETLIDQILINKGLPDVLDYVDIDAVAEKAMNDDRIDTKELDPYDAETIIEKCCVQLGITTANKSVYNQSQLLLNNLNDRDRQIIADSLDSNQDVNTLS